MIQARALLGLQVLTAPYAHALLFAVQQGRWKPTRFADWGGGLQVASEWQAPRTRECVKGSDLAGNDYATGLYLSDLDAITWPQVLACAGTVPRALLMRGDPLAGRSDVNPFGAWGKDAQLAILELRGPAGGEPWARLFELCNAARAATKAEPPWRIWLAGPDFWPLGVMSEVARLGGRGAPATQQAAPATKPPPFGARRK